MGVFFVGAFVELLSTTDHTITKPMSGPTTNDVSSLEPRSIQDLQASKENRASEALKIKDEQIRILSEQNNKLLTSLDKAEEELGSFQLGKLTIEEENRTLRESNFELLAKAKSAEGQLEEIKSGYDDVQLQLSTMTTKNAELFKLLETEEANTTRINAELELCRGEADSLNEQYTALVQTSKESEETARSVTRENQLKTDEIRILRLELDQLRQKNNELTIQSTVELEAIQEQLRLRKEKQYQLLGKLQSQEETSRQAEDHVKEMEQTVRELRQKSSELQTALRLETNARISQDSSNRTLNIDFQVTSAENKELSAKLQDLEQDRLKLEAEARDNGEQLREMAEKVFQLLERLKLAELGKNKSIEALAKKEQELFALKKQYSRIVDDIADQKRHREKMDAEKRLLDDQLRGLKKVNSQLGHKLKEEAKARIREEDSCKEANDKVQTLDRRLAFLLNRLQTDEEARSVQLEEFKKMESQIQSLTQRCKTLQTKLADSEESVRDTDEKLQQTDKQMQEAKIKLESAEQKLQLQEENSLEAERKAIQSKERSEKQHLAGGQLRFFVDNRPTLGKVAIAGRSPKDKVWIEERGCNIFLRKALKGQNVQDALLKRIAELYGAILFGEELLEKANNDLKAREEDLDRFDREMNKMQSHVCSEEESKRRILLRYIRAVKASVSLGEPGCEEDRNEVGRVGAGRIHLPEVSYVVMLTANVITLTTSGHLIS